MKKFENNDRKTPLISPYSLYIKKIKDVKKYSDNTSLTSRNNENENEYENKNNNNYNYNYIRNNNNMSFDNNTFRNNNSMNNNGKNIPISRSLKNINYFGRKNEISNPFYKRADINFYR